jgi:hypothetical protein
MHPESCQCEACHAYANIPYAVLTLRMICPKCCKITEHTDRIHQGTQWAPAVHCSNCDHVQIYEVHVGKIGVTVEARNDGTNT